LGGSWRGGVRVLAIVVLAAVCCAAPAFGQAQPHRRECMKLTNQIERYVGDVERARERDNELWEKATLQHIDRLAERRARLCPEYAKDDEAMKRLARMLRSAGRLALRYFTMGAL
jgi:hypothetical protein